MERLSEQAPELLYIWNGHCCLEQRCKHHSHHAEASLGHGFIPLLGPKVPHGLIPQQKDESSSSIRTITMLPTLFEALSRQSNL